MTRGAATIGVVVFAAHAAVLYPVLNAASQVEDLNVVFGEPKVDAQGRAQVRAQVFPEAVRERTYFRLDGQKLAVTLDSKGVAQVVTPTLRPGTHNLCAEVRYGGNRRRAVCRSLLTGQSVKAGTPVRGAIRFFLPQGMLRALEPVARKRIRQAVVEKLPFGKVDKVHLQLSVVKTGVRAKGKVTLMDKTYANADLTIEAVAKGGKLHLRRRGRTKIKVGGPGAKKISKIASDIGAALGSLFGDGEAKELGRALGKSLVGGAIDGILRSSIEDTLDSEVLPELSKALSLPPSFELGAAWGNLKFTLRYAGKPEFLPGQGMLVSLDVAPVLGKGSRGSWVSVAGKPRPMPTGNEIIVDVSSDVANAMLHALWSNGHLRAALNQPERLASFDKRLKDLVVRPASVRFPLLPQVERVAGQTARLDLVAPDVAVRLVPRRKDRNVVPMDGRVSIRMTMGVAYDAKTRSVAVRARPVDVEMSCVDSTDKGLHLRACFSDAMRIARRALKGGSLSWLHLFSLPLDKLNPLAAPPALAATAKKAPKTKKKGLPVRLEIGKVQTTLADGWIRLKMGAKLRAN